MKNFTPKYDILKIVQREIEDGDTCNLYGMVKAPKPESIADKLIYKWLSYLTAAIKCEDEHGLSDTGNEWVKWFGGSCPVPGHVIVAVKFRDGVIAMDLPANSYCWLHEPDKSDIIAYRVI